MTEVVIEPIEIEIVTNARISTNHGKRLKKAITMCRKQLRCFVPFVSRWGANFLIEALSQRVFKTDELKVRLLICDSPDAYQSGSLDPEALLQLITDCGAEIAGFGDGMHAKVFLTDNSEALVSSANLTRGGLEDNLEIGLVTRDAMVISKLVQEFEVAWRDAEPLSIEDLKTRLKWKQETPVPKKREVPPFRTKSTWRPIQITGSSDAFGTVLFSGFEREDFDVLDPATYGGDVNDDPVKPNVVEDIQNAIENKTKRVLNRFYLALKDYLPNKEYLYPHYASRRRVRNFYPSAAWLGLGRDPKRYVTLAQLSVGLTIDREGKGLFVNFNIGEEYVVNEDKGYFLTWLKRNRSDFVEALSSLDSRYTVRYSHPEKGLVSIEVHKLTELDLDEPLALPESHLLDFHITRRYLFDEEHNLLTRSTVVLEIVDQFLILYRIYRNAFKV